ncbi:hypothetical protein SAMN04489762_2476 [Terribacillus saccharophilus]|uniref:Uncharacterized protein n=1 Tax=Terribacillus saccharophilus TaxID=361277 RepID=A0AAX2EH75_9BACI|nr:hypothetical protein SAMN04489762_2476 [Terribacillus saccharophilus]
MEQYKFKSKHSQMIVDAIVEGYREYIEHRKDRQEKMIISTAFAWTKGNFIEDKLAKECKKHGFSYRLSKAGPTWDYIQFIHGESKILFLSKNAAYFDENKFSQAVLPIEAGKGSQRRTYLHELSKINSELEFPTIDLSKHTKVEQQEQLSLFVTKSEVIEELLQFKKEFNEFHILTYQLDDAYQLSEILHYLPNPATNVAYLIEDLTDYISGADLSEEDREAVSPSSQGMERTAEQYDIGILEDLEEEEN